MSDAASSTAGIGAGVGWAGTGLSYWLNQIGIHQWSDAASMAAFFSAVLAGLCSVLVIVDWWRKRMGRK